MIKAREKARLTQAQIAENIGISRSFYGLIENGTRNPNYGLAVKIAQVLSVPVGSIFFDLDGFRMKRKPNHDQQCATAEPDPAA